MWADHGPNRGFWEKRKLVLLGTIRKSWIVERELSLPTICSKPQRLTNIQSYRPTCTHPYYQFRAATYALGHQLPDIFCCQSYIALIVYAVLNSLRRCHPTYTSYSHQPLPPTRSPTLINIAMCAPRRAQFRALNIILYCATKIHVIRGHYLLNTNPLPTLLLSHTPSIWNDSS